MQFAKMGKFIAVLHRRQQKHIMAAIKVYDLSYSDYDFLLCISKNPGCNQKDICQDLGIDEAIATRVVKQLETRGYIIREKHESDGRSYKISLTKKGEDITPLICDVKAKWWRDLSGNCTAEEQEWLYNQLEYMTDRSGEKIK